MLNKIVFVTFLFRLITYLLEKTSTWNYRELSLPLLFHFPLTLFHENSPNRTSLPPPPPSLKKTALLKRRYKKRKKSHWFCVASLCDWPGKLAKPAQTVRSNFKGNHDLVTSVFASVEQITFLFSYRISFYFVLIRAMIRQGDLLHSPPRCDWSRRLAPPSSALWFVKETRSTLSTNQTQH